MKTIRPNHDCGRRDRGFTLIEAAIVTVIVGVGIVGMLQLMAAGTMANAQATELTTAMGLAGNIHERALGVKYANVFSAFDNKNYSPPIDAKGNVINELTAGWKQTVDVQKLDENNIRNTVPDTQDSPICRVTVSISHGNRTVYTSQWLVAASEWP